MPHAQNGVCPILSWLTAAALAAPQWQVDGTSLSVHRGQHPIEAAIACEGAIPDDAPVLFGERYHTLGVAIVAYSKKQGTMSWGHASLRYLYCRGDGLVDAELEAYRLSGWNEGILRTEHAGEGFADGPWLRTQRGALVLFRNRRPVDAGWYAEQQAENREIYEVWLDLPQQELDAVVASAEQAHHAQLERLRSREDLASTYVAWSRRNCTIVFHDHLPASIRDVVGAPITPFAWVRRVEDHALAHVLHPSHHLVNRWNGALPEAVERLHPLFRRRKRLRASVFPALRRSLQNAAPILPP